VRRLVPILVLAALGAMVAYLPWWATLAIVVVGAWAVKKFAWKLVEKLMIGAFRAKSAALAGADATLHGITRAEPPKSDPDSTEDSNELESGPLRWVHVDLTMNVPEDNGGKTPFRLWEPGELRLAPIDAKPGPDFADEEEVGTIAGIELWDAGHWVTLDEKLQGSQRIRLHAGVKPGVDYFKLRYYFEIIENRDTVWK
jgi:hypothetical protein